MVFFAKVFPSGNAIGGVPISKDYRINERINVPQVRVISDTGDQLGVIPTREALRIAREQGLDLVEVAPQAVPPVCRILDYGKLRYLTSKKEKESRKTQKVTELREVRFRPNIGEHDLDAKIRKTKELLDEGAKVKVSVFHRGREMSHLELGMNLLKRVADAVKDDSKLEKPPAVEGRSLTMVLQPPPGKGGAVRPEGQDEKEEELADA